jgi:hypothetical protein
MAQNDNILSFTGHKVSGRQINLNSGERKAVDNCRQVLAWMMPQLIEGMFDKLDDALFDLSNKADSNELQTQYFDAMRVLRKERESLENGFQRRVLGAYDEFWRLGDIPALREAFENGGETDNLSLVGEEELEEKLATTNMISKGDSRYYRELYALEQRFSRLAHEVVVDSNNNPISPSTICRLFRDTIQSLELDLPVKLVVYKLFDKEVMQYLGGLYDGINDVLAQAGILPKLSKRVKQNPVSPAVQRGSYKPGADAEGKAVAKELENEIDLELFPRLQELLNLRRGPAAASGQTQAQQLIDSSQVVSALSNLQQGNFALISFGPEGVVVPENIDLREHLLQQLNIGKGADGSGAINRTDENIIDVISMLFDFILEDHNLPDAMKALLSRLQIPMVKVAILDKDFFGRKSHPARLLLNNLAKAALGWFDDGDRSEKSLYGKIETIVSRVLSDYDRDIELFNELNQEFAEFLGKEQQASKVAEERATQVTRGKEQLQLGKQEVEEEIETRFRKAGTLPEAVISLIRDGWKDVLLLIALRKGLESQEWKDGLAMMDQLIWSVTPKTSREEQRELLDAIPVLLKGLRKELNEISYDQHKTARLFKELQACHVVSLRGERVSGINPLPESESGNGAKAAKEAGEAVAPTRQVEKTTTADKADDDLRRAESLQVGAWIEHKASNDEAPKRIKLAWKSVVTGNHLFVNRKGIKIMELSLEELAEAISAGTIALLEEANKPLLDRAMTAIVSNLQQGQTA